MTYIVNLVTYFNMTDDLESDQEVRLIEYFTIIFLFWLQFAVESLLIMACSIYIPVEIVQNQKRLREDRQRELEMRELILE